MNQQDPKPRDYLNPALDKYVAETHLQIRGLVTSIEATVSDLERVVHEPSEAPRRHRGLLIIAALVAAIGAGGAVAYTYKTFIQKPPYSTIDKKGQ